ncbi:hypothetical protein CDD80_6302 [Ophiocordyceps camponoti-rufipedis]|uniref:Uncharacterized protein n=1 Tax=Ophiocordyceps camponoti-rufipedis TaxID=2004952 RepID=A0A2C5ZHS5_9HYPO|nr:hypothetical protein CDD80_6302 [Ophiocordyceps camponoti-rufipedis]
MRPMDAQVYTLEGDDREPSSMTLIFDHLSTVVGPLNYDEVLHLAQHYLGFCGGHVGVYSDDPGLLIQLVPVATFADWLCKKEQALSSCYDWGRVIDSRLLPENGTAVEGEDVESKRTDSGETDACSFAGNVALSMYKEAREEGPFRRQAARQAKTQLPAEMPQIKAPAATGIDALNCKPDPSRLLEYLRDHPSSGTITFERNQVWSPKSKITSRELFRVTACVAFESPDVMKRCLATLSGQIAVDAQVWCSTNTATDSGQFSMAFVFSHLNLCDHVTEIMSYEIVIRRVQHYFGHCALGSQASKSDQTSSDWMSSEVSRLMIQLVPISCIRQWLVEKEAIFSMCENRGELPGRGFKCNTPCSG